MRVGRWLLGLGALLIAALALYVVLTVRRPPASLPETLRPAMDEIDAESRAAMRKLLREQGED